jgi:fructose-1-phosphate kinase PfkB-like protein
MSGLEIREGSKTFRWHGRYHDDVNQRDTVAVELNVLAERGPEIPQNFRDSDYVFLANTHPGLQMELLGQCDEPALVVADTMDLWINTEKPLLMELLGKLDGIVLNDSEALLLTGKHNIVEAGLEIARLVKKFCVVKKGEHGCLLFIAGLAYPLPGWPSSTVVDPTGAGDCFAGGMMGYIAERDDVSSETLRKASAYGTVVASLELEDFSLNKLTAITKAEIDARLKEYHQLIQFQASGL